MLLRRARADEDWDALTSLLHRAYAGLAAQGLRFYASHQAPSVTQERAGSGECWIGEVEGRPVCTVTLVPPDRTKGTDWYDQPDVAKVQQWAVDPDFRGLGFGRRLLDHVEDRARELGATELALDTAEGATRLIDTYTRRGYRFVQHVDWRPHTNYRSVLLSRTLGPPVMSGGATDAP